MKALKLFVMVLAGLALSAVASRAALTLDFSSTPGASIQFNGAASSFQFNTSTSNNYVGSQWVIGNEVGGTGSAIGLFGAVTNGPFSYGPISTPFTGLQIATVSNVPLGSLSINDGEGDFLTGNIAWVQLDTFQFSGGINASLMVNVTSLTYSGTNQDLLTLVENGPAAMDLTFQFSPGLTLSDLTSGSGPFTTSFSGSISVSTTEPTPEPTTVGCFLLGLGVLACCQRFAKKRHV